MNDRTYQCFLRDISIGGAYLETNQPIKRGRRLTLFLSASARESYTTIHGTVVRQDRQGLGICFEQLSNEQKQLIRSLVLSKRSSTAEPLHTAA